MGIFSACRLEIMPRRFAANNIRRTVKFPALGGGWSRALVRQKLSPLDLRFDTRVRRGRVRRELSLVAGHNVVYSRTLIEGFAGPTPFAHHAILAVSEREQSLLCDCSPFWTGRTYPTSFGSPAAGEYESLAPGATFRDLRKVPSIFRARPLEDCTAFPTRRGFCDVIQVFEKPKTRGVGLPSWFKAVNSDAGWLWFAFKDPRLMPGRVYWMENRGRHGAPWKGRNACLGIEDGCMYFDLGLAESARANPISRLGIPTSVQLRRATCLLKSAISKGSHVCRANLAASGMSGLGGGLPRFNLPMVVM